MSKLVFKKRYLFAAIAVVFCICAGVFIAQIPLYKIYSLPADLVIYRDDIAYINQSKLFGGFVTVNIPEQQITADTGKNKEEFTVQFKLFNLIPIKTQKVKILTENDILAGGVAVGIVLNSDGALIVGSGAVATDEGEEDIFKTSGLEIGDLITHINDEKVENTGSISKIINSAESKDKEVKITAIRKNKEYTTRVKPAYDIKSESYKLGIWVRDDATGIGTLTYITAQNRFGALGHPICDSDTKTMFTVKNGTLYNCNIVGVNKGVAGDPGEIKGLFSQGKNEQGHIDKNNEFGVFGEVKEGSKLFEYTQEMKIGGRLTVTPGRAQIRCCLDGSQIKLYDIEIIKTNYQNFSDDKSMVLRVTDKELLEKTGGIIQGMSGSPIIQNGKLVGAVTHVFVNDPSKGFGVYLDWMYGE